MHERPEVLSPTEARQASPRRMNLRVLATSLIFALVVGVVLYALFYGTQTKISTTAPAPSPAETTAPGP
jgi:hypothetical protein